MSGYDNGKFGPSDSITREQLAVTLRNYANYKKKNRGLIMMRMGCITPDTRCIC